MTLPSELPHQFSARAFLGIAVPMIVSRAGLAVMGIVDGIMVSRYDPRSFASLSLAEGTLGRLLDIAIAFLIGGLSLVPRHVARGDVRGAVLLWRRTVPVAVLLGVIGCAVGLFGRPLLSLIGQAPDLASGAAPVMAILGAGYSAALIAISAAVFLEGVGRPKLVAISVVSANVANVVLNGFLINGHAGLPAMGPQGAALSTTIVRVALAAVLVVGVLRLRSPAEKNEDAHAAERLSSRRAQWRLSFGTCAAVAVMVILTSSLTVFAGQLGVMPLATFAAAWGLATPLALVTLGLSDATGLYVSAEAGRGGDRRAAAVSRRALLVSLAVIVPLALVLVVAAGSAGALYTHDTRLRQSIASVLPVVACILVVDCLGFAMAASLRAVKDVAWPAGIEIVSMVALVPIAASLAMAYGMGVRGLFVAMLVAGTVRSVALALRFRLRTAGNPAVPQIVGLDIGV